MKKIGNKGKSRFLWALFFLTTGVALFTLTGEYLGLDLVIKTDRLIMFLPIVLFVLHLAWTLTYTRAVIFILIASLTGLIFEIIGVKYGVVFGGHYAYRSQNFGLMLFDVPLLVAIYWAIFIYAGYAITSSFLFWANKKKPERKQNDITLLPLLVFLDGLIAVAIDVFMDPLMVNAGNWAWVKGGPYFGVPIGNFTGWFMVTIIATGIFRTFEYFFPQKPSGINKSVFLMVVIAYGMLCVSLIFSAINIQLPDLALIGFFVMMPVVIINLISFINWKRTNTAELQNEFQ